MKAYAASANGHVTIESDSGVEPRSAPGPESPFLGDPEPLPDFAKEAMKLDPDLIPVQWREWITDIAERMQCPLDYPAAAAIVQAGSLLGNKIRMRPKRHDEWTVVPNLYGAIVGKPGSLKSPAVGEAMRPLHLIAERERERFEKSLTEYRLDLEVAEVQRAQVKKEFAKSIRTDEFRKRLAELEVKEPVERRLFTSDCTIEKLGELLNANSNGILVNRDELTGFLRGLERAGHEQDRAFYLEAWNGTGSFIFDRIQRGTTRINNLTVSILGTIQPSMIQSYLRTASETAGADGLIQRFQILVYPEPSKAFHWVDRPCRSSDHVQRLFTSMYDCSPEDVGAKQLTTGESFLQFDAPAQTFFEDWHTSLENTVRGGEIDDPALVSHLGKYRSLMPSLALIFSTLDILDRKAPIGSVSLASAMLAADWCEYFRTHAERLYSMRGSVYDTGRLILAKIRSGKLPELFTARDVYTKGWSGLAETRVVNEALETLVEHGYVAEIHFPSAGRRTTKYTIHPHCYDLDRKLLTRSYLV